MIGAVLSRWTMLYFATALLSLLAAEAMMSAGLGFPAEALRAPATLVVVHLVTIGWLSLTMCGALGQFIPVLTERPLHSNRLPLPALAVFSGVREFPARVKCATLAWHTLESALKDVHEVAKTE